MPEVYEVVTRAEDNSRMFAIYKKPNLLSREDERRLIFLSNNREVAQGLCDHFNYPALSRFGGYV